MRHAVAAVIVLAVVALGGWYAYANRGGSSRVEPVATTTSGSVGEKGGNLLPMVGKQAPQGEIIIERPRVGDKISSPISVSGRARGRWFSEATAPVMVIDVNGKVLGRGSVTAQGDWMTASGTVPFSGTVSFTGKTADQGAVVFMNDNPSGLEANALYYAVPVFLK